jgi:hypothetical protein
VNIYVKANPITNLNGTVVARGQEATGGATEVIANSDVLCVLDVCPYPDASSCSQIIEPSPQIPSSQSIPEGTGHPTNAKLKV